LEKLLTLFSDNLLPIFLTAGAGFIIRKKLDIDPKSISRIIFYLFSPALVFTLLTKNQLDGQNSLRIVGYAVSATVLIGIITWIICTLLKFDRKLTIAVIITVMFTNAGNFGLSLNNFAFGEEALSFASLYFVTSAIMIYTIGIALTSMGKMSFLESIKRLFSFPAIYAVILALLFNNMGWTLPIPVERSVSMLSDATIPAMLVLLGMQLSSVDFKADVLALGTASVLRLVAAPLLAIGLAVIFKLEGAAYQASVIEASMPTAVLTTVLATEFNVRPRFVTSVVTLTTILSPLMLTPLISYLGG
jgi:predicted permease